MINRIKIYVSVALLMFCLPLFSQETNGVLSPVSKGEIGIAGGTSYYTGDFNESFVPYMISPMGGLFYRYNFTKYINARVQVSGGIVKGDSRNYAGGLQGFPQGTNLAFQRNFLSADVFAEFNFFPYSSVDPRNRYSFAPFLILGAGYTYFTKNSVNNPAFASASAAYPMLYDSLTTTSGVVIPMGFGFKLSPARQWTIGFECVVYKTNTDKIDHYTNRSSRDGGFNIFNKDWVSTICLTLSYRFIDSSPCSSYKTNKSAKKRNYKGILK